MDSELANLKSKLDELSGNVEKYRGRPIIWKDWEKLVQMHKQMKNYYYSKIDNEQKQNEEKYQNLKMRLYFLGGKIEECFVDQARGPIMCSLMDPSWFVKMSNYLFYLNGLVACYPESLDEFLPELDAIKAAMLDLEQASHLGKEKCEFWKQSTMFRHDWLLLKKNVEDLALFNHLLDIFL